MQSPESSHQWRYFSARAYLRFALVLWVVLWKPANLKPANACATDFYTAGVVEFRPNIAGMSSADMLADHLKAYMDIIESTDAQDTDIIVFPEGTLNNDFHLTYVPSEKDRVIPCVENATTVYSDFLVELSCAARRSSKYLVINLSEKENCTQGTQDTRPCASSGLNVYNSNVVFDREGRVVSRYRKVHVYVENKNTTYQPEYGIFETDFGVTFGHFICFDILFYTPAKELVDHYGVTDIVFTSFFYSELPFLTATQLQHGWAWGNDVNLLAAGASYPKSGTTGTGIYAGRRGTLVSVMAKHDGQRKLYKARVKKVNKKCENSKALNRTEKHAREVDSSMRPRRDQHISYNVQKQDIHLLKDPQIENYNSVLLDVTKSTEFKQKLCYDELCCSFDMEVETIPAGNTSHRYHYRIGVFDGRRSYEKAEWSDIKVCALYACASDSKETCGELLEELGEHAVTFRRLHIKGNFSKTQKMLIMPTTIDQQLDPLATEHMQWTKKDLGSYYEMDFALTNEHNNLLTFGIYAMYFEKSDGRALEISTLLLVILLQLRKIFS